ncbi:Hypothetical protein, putative [Bodo saltans]|uniref:Uncharacterized protein n=1 Tax=Bodo saltans TaxID=75058 RepID=A0A0S4IN07_BODSA|nr:Hypothetical protein, putative [Bodo saltans]|eukprot:CUE77136.1 Hypothetical protein, putative [Bodo saltans]
MSTSIVTFDRRRKAPTTVVSSSATLPLMDSPRTLLACSQEGLDPNEDFYFKEPKDLLLQCRGDRQAAKLKCEHYLTRRDELIDIVTKKREVIIEAMDLTRRNLEAANELKALTSVTTPLSGAGPTSGAGFQQSPGARSGTAGSDSAYGASGSDGFGNLPPSRMADIVSQTSDHNSAQRAAGLLTKKAKLEKQILRMQQVVEANKERQKQEEEEAKRMKAIFAEKEAERAKQKEHDELERKFKEVQIRRRAQQEREERQRREEERAEELERQRQARVLVAEELEQREIERQEKLEQDRRRLEKLAAEKQLEVAMRLEEKKAAAEEVERQRREVIQEKMLEADERRLKLEESNEAQLAARKVTSDIKTKENKGKRDRAAKLFVEKITRFEDKAKIAEIQREKQQEELENYFLHCRLEEAKKERLRREVLKHAQEQEVLRERELQERLVQVEKRIEHIAEEKARNAVLRRVEKELILEDKAHQMLRNRRLLEHESEEGRARFEEKIRRIVAMQDESREADDQRRDLMRRSLLAIKKRIPEPTPGPSDYGAGSALSYIGHKDGAVKMSNAARGSLFAKPEDSPGPGQYTTVPSKSHRGGKLKPLTVMEKQRAKEQRAMMTSSTNNGTKAIMGSSAMHNNFSASLNSSSIVKFPRHSTPPRALSTPLTTVKFSVEDYNSDEDFD